MRSDVDSRRMRPSCEGKEDEMQTDQHPMRRCVPDSRSDDRCPRGDCPSIHLCGMKVWTPPKHQRDVTMKHRSPEVMREMTRRRIYHPREVIQNSDLLDWGSTSGGDNPEWTSNHEQHARVNLDDALSSQPWKCLLSASEIPITEGRNKNVLS